MKNIKIIIASIVAIILLGGFAFAKIPDRTQKLVNFHKALVTERQEDWKNLDEEQHFYQDKVNELVLEKQKIEEEADIFRETIAVLRNDPIGVDTTDPTQPKN